jgi:hypothetical protein
MKDVTRNSSFREIRVTESINGGKANGITEAVVGCIFLAFIGVAAYFVLAYVLLPLIGSLLLILLAVASALLLFTKTSTYDQSVPLMTAIGNKMREKNPSASDEEAAKGFATALVIFLFVCVIMTTTVIAFALNSGYQMFPLNYLGAMATGGMIFINWSMASELFRLSETLKKPFKPTIWGKKVAFKISFALACIYPAAIFLVKFGIIR